MRESSGEISVINGGKCQQNTVFYEVFYEVFYQVKEQFRGSV